MVLHLSTFEFCAADSDYQSVSTVITFPPTSIVAIECPQVPIINDAISEPDETFQIQISTASCQVAQSTFTVTILGIAIDCHYVQDEIFLATQITVNQILCCRAKHKSAI